MSRVAPVFPTAPKTAGNRSNHFHFHLPKHLPFRGQGTFKQALNCSFYLQKVWKALSPNYYLTELNY